MKSLITVILFIISFVSSGQEVMKQTIVFVDIHMDRIDGNSAFMVYKDSSGVTHSDLRFEDDIYVDGVILFDYDDGIIVYFNEEYADELIGKNIVMTYYEKEIKYFGVVPFVISLGL